MVFTRWWSALLFVPLVGIGSYVAAQPMLSLPFNEPSFAVTSGWYYDRNSIHRAIDYSLPRGTPVYAAADGVAFASTRVIPNTESFGTFVFVYHENGFSTVYAHLDSVEDDIHTLDFVQDSVQTNSDHSSWSPVTRGDVIGYVGETGTTGGVHLHFEVSENSAGTYTGHYIGKRDPYDIHNLASYYPPTGSNFDACGADALWAECPPLPPSTLQETALIGVVPDVFTTDGGSFEVSVSPKDADGNLISSGVTASNFGFDNISVALSSTPDEEVSGGSALTTDVETILPTEGDSTTPVLTFDSSGSMATNDRDRLRVEAGKQFVALLEADDQAAVTDFGVGSTAGLRVSRLLQDFTSDKVLLNDAIDQVVAYGGTPLYDAILDSLDLLDSVLSPNPAVVVLTDGEENASASTLPDVVTHANTLGIPLFTVGLGDGVGFPQLQTLAGDTGGVFAEASDANALSVVFENIGFGIVQGRVVVTGQGTFVPPLQQAGEYIVSGNLVTTIGGNSTGTPFSFPVDVEEVGSVTGASASPYYRIPYTAEEERQKALEFMYEQDIAE